MEKKTQQYISLSTRIYFYTHICQPQFWNKITFPFENQSTSAWYTNRDFKNHVGDVDQTSPAVISLENCTIVSLSRLLIPSPIRRTVWANYPKYESVPVVSEYMNKSKMKGSHSYSPVVVKASNLVISRPR